MVSLVPHVARILVRLGSFLPPIGQLLWEKELYSYKEFPPLQAPETYNLDGILKQMEKNKGDD